MKGPLNPDRSPAERPLFGWILAPVFVWSLNDAIGSAMASWPSEGLPATALLTYTRALVTAWLLVMLGVLALVASKTVPGRPIHVGRAIVAFIPAGLFLALVQMLTADPTDVRALHLVVDLAAIGAVLYALIKIQPEEAAQPPGAQDSPTRAAAS